MSEATIDRLQALAAVPEGTVLAPSWQSGSSEGFVYLAGGTTLFVNDLEELAERGFLERTFVERLSLCPHCSSHALNVHEACPSCDSSNLTLFKAYFHFRCGYVGPVESFKAEAHGLRCPKCNRILRDLGTDHDSPGEYLQCNGCSSMFQTPNVAARCLSCGAALTRDAMAKIGHRDVFSYRLTGRGKAALLEAR
jgi:hypothetical protein